MRFLTRLAASCAGLLAATAFADYKAGLDALGVKDYARARAAFEAEPANASAIYQLSRMASQGLGEARNDVRAAGLFKRAADLGHVAAKADYAFALANGRGVAKDTVQAHQILEELAASGQPGALVDLGRALQLGWSGTKDEVRAAELFRRASDAGNDSGSRYFALALLSGAGVPKDEARAAELLKAAAARGHSAARLDYARLLSTGTGVAKDETAALGLFRTVGNAGNPEAQYAVALAYANGRGVARDDAVAVRWADSAARQGYTPAQHYLGEAFRSGRGVPVLASESYYWLTLAGRGSGTAAERARERRATVAQELDADTIARMNREADAFRPSPGFLPRQHSLPALAQGPSIPWRGTQLDIPFPQGYVNGWQFAERLRSIQPNSPLHRASLMVLQHGEDVARIPTGTVKGLRTIEFAPAETGGLESVSASFFTDLKKRLRSSAEASAASGNFRLERIVRDDERSLGFVRSGPAGNTLDAVAFLYVRDQVLILMFSGYLHEHRAELQELVDSLSERILSDSGSTAGRR